MALDMKAGKEAARRVSRSLLAENSCHLPRLLLLQPTGRHVRHV